MKKLLIVSTIVVLFVMSLFTAFVKAEGTTNFLGGNIMTANNNTRGGGWQDPVSALPGEAVEFRIVAQNQGDNTASNVRVSASLQSGRATTLTASGTVSADNAASVTDTATVNVEGGSSQEFAFIPGHNTLFSPSCPSGCPVSDSIVSGGISVGNLEPGQSAQVTFKAYVSNIVAATPTPTGTPTPTPTGTVTPTPTKTPTPTAPVTVAPTAPPAGNVLQCPEGFVETISGSNIICLQQIQNQSQTSTSESNVTTGDVNVTTGDVNVNVTQEGAVQGAVAPIVTPAAPVTQVTQLPKTGLPALAWILSGLLPLGTGLKRFGAFGQSHSNHEARTIWQKREFEKE